MMLSLVFSHRIKSINIPMETSNRRIPKQKTRASGIPKFRLVEWDRKEIKRVTLTDVNSVLCKEKPCRIILPYQTEDSTIFSYLLRKS